MKSNFCDYSDAYSLVKGDITVTAALPTQVSFRNGAPFIKCITKIDGTTIYDAEDFDLAMPMCNLIEYSSNSSETTGSLWFYSKDEASNFNVDIANGNTLKFFNYRTRLLENTVANKANGILKNATIAVALKLFN